MILCARIQGVTYGRTRARNTKDNPLARALSSHSPRSPRLLSICCVLKQLGLWAGNMWTVLRTAAVGLVQREDCIRMIFAAGVVTRSIWGQDEGASGIFQRRRRRGTISHRKEARFLPRSKLPIICGICRYLPVIPIFHRPSLEWCVLLCVHPMSSRQMSLCCFLHRPL